jgi:aminoglycoside phosphotransferase (APT) family kinase protein
MTGTPAPLASNALEAFLDAHGIGRGSLDAERIGEGESNLNYRVTRGGARVVVRRPPLPPLPPSAHDVVREGRIQRALAEAGALVPRVLAICDDESILGAPFYVMEEVDGIILGRDVPAALEARDERQRVGTALIDALVHVHAVDWHVARLEGIAKPVAYLERQLRRWTQLWEINATRDLPAFSVVADRLWKAMPQSRPATVVHGDYRLGNVVISATAPVRVVAVLDWEMATIGDPLADLGYLLVSWSEPRTTDHPLLLSPVTAQPGFPSRAELIDRYAQRSGRDVSGLDWYQALAFWKAAVFCDAIHGRYLRGERHDAWSGALAKGVPRLVECAQAHL